MFNLFLVKEIKSKDGVLHFRRWNLFSCPWFSIHIHKIYKSDEDHPHSHPWNFISIILAGGYFEDLTIMPCQVTRKVTRRFCSFAFRRFGDYHKITLIKPTTTLVFTGKRLDENWGYYVDGNRIRHVEYRQAKQT